MVELIPTFVALLDGRRGTSVGAVLSVVPDVWNVDSELDMMLPASSCTPVNAIVYSWAGSRLTSGSTVKCTLSSVVTVTATSVVPWFVPWRRTNDVAKFPSGNGSEKTISIGSVPFTLVALPAGLCRTISGAITSAVEQPENFFTVSFFVSRRWWSLLLLMLTVQPVVVIASVVVNTTDLPSLRSDAFNTPSDVPGVVS